MAKDRYAPKPLNDIISGLTGRLASYAGKSEALNMPQNTLADFLGPNLSKKCRVSQYQDGTLMIEAISAPIALRLNYLKMDILSHFRSQGMVELAQVKITANPQATQRLAPEMGVKGAQAAAPKKRKMSEKTAEHLNAIAADAPPSLKEKLQRLAKHAKG